MGGERAGAGLTLVSDQGGGPLALWQHWQPVWGFGVGEWQEAELGGGGDLPPPDPMLYFGRNSPIQRWGRREEAEEKICNHIFKIWERGRSFSSASSTTQQHLAAVSTWWWWGESLFITQIIYLDKEFCGLHPATVWHPCPVIFPKILNPLLNHTRGACSISPSDSEAKPVFRQERFFKNAFT